MLKRAILSISFMAVMLWSVPVQAQVLDEGLPEAGSTSGYNTTGQSLPTTVGIIISVVVGILGVVFLILTLYAGILWMTAAGDPKQVDKAKSILVAAVIGLIIALSAYAITNFVVTALKGTQATTPPTTST